MKKVKNAHKKLLSILLVIIMVVSIVPMSMFSITASAVSGSEIVAYARRFIGYPYVYGTQGPNSFDCSGFVQYVFKHFGISLPASSSSYWNNPTAYGTVVGSGSTANAKAGDVISWNGHVAIYTENGKCVEALNPSYGVTESVPVNSHTNGTNYRVIRISGVSHATSKPTNLKISANCTSIGVGDTVTFTYNIDGATNRCIGIDKNGSRYKSIGVSRESGSVSYTFTEAGTYCCIIEGSNDIGYSCSSSGVWITVINSKPTDFEISANKTSIGVGDTVTFTYNIKGATNKSIGIDKNGSRYKSIGVSANSGTVSYTFTEEGTYCCIIEGYNNIGYSCISKGVWITVGDNYTITYNPNGGSVSPTSKSVSAGSSTTLPTPNKSYKVTYNANGGSGVPSTKTVSVSCKGWAASGSATSASYSCGASYKPTKDITLYAVWNSSTSTNLSSTIPTRDGYTFLGWAKSSSATTATYEAGDTITLTGNTILYAVWEKLPVSTGKGITDVTAENKYLKYNELSKLVIEFTGEDCDYEIEYASSDASIATVSEDGYVSANGRGTAKITVTVTDEYGNVVEDTCTVEVKFAWYQWVIYIVLFGWIWY